MTNIGFQTSSTHELHAFAREACRTHPVTRDEYDLSWPGMRPGIDEMSFFAQRLHREARQRFGEPQQDSRFAEKIERAFQAVDDCLADLNGLSIDRNEIREAVLRKELLENLRFLSEWMR